MQIQRIFNAFSSFAHCLLSRVTVNCKKNHISRYFIVLKSYEEILSVSVRLLDIRSNTTQKFHQSITPKIYLIASFPTTETEAE